MEQQSEASHGIRKVLILEADEVLKDMMIELLGRHDFGVTAARTLDEAVSALSETKAIMDMIIFDADTVSSSIPNGTLTKWQAWLSKLRHPMPCIIVSVHPAAARRLRFLLSIPGLQSRPSESIWLQKPFRNDEFLSAVRQIPAGNQAKTDALGTARL